MDCTRPLRQPASRRRVLLGAIVIAVLLLTWGWLAGQARADGDPASDVLATQPLFVPQDAGIPVRQQTELGALQQLAQKRGYQIRVAIVASATDLGSVTALWRQPQQYAEFLGEELSIVYKGPLLVVMPNGLGVYGSGATGRSAIADIHPSATGAGIGAGAISAVQRLAAAAGHPLELPAAGATGSSGSTDVLAWVVFAIGLALIALAWAVSVRVRPFRAAAG